MRLQNERRPGLSSISFLAQWLALGAVLALAAVGCSPDGGGTSLELTGPEALGRLPEGVLELIPADAILCHDEEMQNGDLHLWIVRKPGGTWLTFPAKTKGLDHHDMPPSALLSILGDRLPALKAGEPSERRCRFTHWPTAEREEIQVREIVTDHGWFASVERVRM